MTNKGLTCGTGLEMPEKVAKDRQFYGHHSCLSGRTRRENHSLLEPQAGAPQMVFGSMKLVKGSRTVRHKSKPLQKEERVPSRYLWREILAIVLGATLIKSAAAHTAIGIAEAASSGSVMSHSLENYAALLLIAVVYLHELFRILTLCQFAAPIPAQSADATNESAQPPRHGTPTGPTAAFSRVAKRSTAEMSLPAALISLSRKFG